MTNSEILDSTLADLRWLQRLATVLAHDSDEADDLVQSTLVTAWSNPPRDGEQPLRPWLATVLRNLWRMRRRAGARREVREQASVPVDADQAPPDQELARLEVLRVLLAELERLGPEDRKIIVRRYFEGESAAEIARALAIPAATVRSRILRSLQRLRGALDQRLGSRSSWCAAVLAVHADAAVPHTNITRGETMSITAKIVVVGSIGTLGLSGWCAQSGVEAPPERPAQEVAAPTATADAPVNAPRTVWATRRHDIRKTMPAALASGHARGPAPGETSSFQALLNACVEDLGADTSGMVTLAVTEIGTPDVGTIYDSIELITTTYTDAETLECVTESMYAWVGEAPEEAFARRQIRTFTLGEPADAEAALQNKFDFIVGAHIGEIHHCQKFADGEPAHGTLTLAATLGDGRGGARAVEIRGDEIPAAVRECVRTAGLRWIWPTELAGQTREHRITLPIHVPPPGPLSMEDLAAE